MTTIDLSPLPMESRTSEEIEIFTKDVCVMVGDNVTSLEVILPTTEFASVNQSTRRSSSKYHGLSSMTTINLLPLPMESWPSEEIEIFTKHVCVMLMKFTERLH